jgi:hypothetical protein
MMALAYRYNRGSPEIQTPTWNTETETDAQQTLRQSEFNPTWIQLYE